MVFVVCFMFARFLLLHISWLHGFCCKFYVCVVFVAFLIVAWFLFDAYLKVALILLLFLLSACRMAACFYYMLYGCKFFFACLLVALFSVIVCLIVAWFWLNVLWLHGFLHV